MILSIAWCSFAEALRAVGPTGSIRCFCFSSHFLFLEHPKEKPAIHGYNNLESFAPLSVQQQ